MRALPNSELQELRTRECNLLYGHTAQTEELLVPELRRMLRTRARLILTSSLAGLLLAMAYVCLRAPRYQARAAIEVSPAGTNSMGLDDQTTRMLSPSDPTIQLQSAAAVLESNTVALAVMQQTRLAERGDFAGRWTQPAGTDVSTLSPEVRDKLLQRFRKGLKVEIVPKTDIITVAFRARDAKLAADVVNATVSSYAERNFRSSYDAATQVSSWLSAQMDDLKLKANDAQEKLAALQKKRGLIGGDENDNIVTEKLKDLNEQLTNAEADRIVKEARYRIAGSGNPELIASSVPDVTLQVLRTQQAQLQADYARLNTKFGEGYPKLAEVQNQMAQVDGAINAELKNLAERYKNEYLASAGAEKMLRGKFDDQKQKAYDLTQGAAQYAILQHEVEATQDLYQTLQLKPKQAGIVAGLASANIAVVESGQVPSEPVDPRPPLDLAIGLGGGLLIGAVSALTLEMLDTSVRNGLEAESVTALPILTEIPQVRRRFYGDKISAAEVSAQLRLIAHHQPHSPVAESYRRLRTALLLGEDGPAAKVLVVTSCLPGEGKTLTAINCALVLAQQGAKVLLVDGDLRDPSVHQAFGVPQDPGMTKLLVRPDAGDTIATAQVLPNLDVLSAGAACLYPAEMLASDTMSRLVAQWRARYEHIVFDTPPVSMFTDAVLLASRADAVLLVARSGVTTRTALRDASNLLQRAKLNVSGVVLNGVDPRYNASYYQPYPKRSFEHLN